MPKVNYTYQFFYLGYLTRRRPESKEPLCELLGVTRTTLARWIAGDTQPTPAQLAEIANYYNENIETFFLKPDPFAPSQLLQ